MDVQSTRPLEGTRADADPAPDRPRRCRKQPDMTAGRHMP